jgi:hypothetical protein
MLEKIIEYLNLKLKLTKYFEHNYSLAEIRKSSDNKDRPVIYDSKGNAIDINNLSKYYGVSYFRKNDISISFDSADLHPANGNTLIVNFPLRLVVAIRKSELTKDDNYSEDRVAQTIIKQLSDNTSDLRKLINAKAVRVSVANYSTNNNAILGQEFSGFNQFDIDYSIAYLSFTVNVEVRATKSCIESECENVDSDILHAFDFCENNTFLRLTEEQKSCLIEKLGDCPTSFLYDLYVNGLFQQTVTIDVNQDINIST